MINDTTSDVPSSCIGKVGVIVKGGIIIVPSHCISAKGEMVFVAFAVNKIKLFGVGVDVKDQKFNFTYILRSGEVVSM